MDLREEIFRTKPSRVDVALNLASLLALKVPVDPVADMNPEQRAAQIRMRGHIHTAIRSAFQE